MDKDNILCLLDDLIKSMTEIAQKRNAIERVDGNIDKLIKEEKNNDNDEPYFSIKSKIKQQKKNRELDVNKSPKKVPVNRIGVVEPKTTYGPEYSADTGEEDVWPRGPSWQKKTEDASNNNVNKLVSLLKKKSILNKIQPSSDDMIYVGESMNLGAKEDEAKDLENKWDSVISDWLIEAAKPLNTKFSSEKEEIDYWNSIKILDNGENDKTDF